MKPECNVTGCDHGVAAYRDIDGKERALCLRHHLSNRRGEVLEFGPRQKRPKSALLSVPVASAPKPTRPKAREIVPKAPISPPKSKPAPKPAPTSRKPARGAVDGLSKTDEKLLKYLRFVVSDDRVIPRQTRIAERMGWASHGNVSQYLKRLQAKGYIRKIGRGRYVLLAEQASTGSDDPSTLSPRVVSSIEMEAHRRVTTWTGPATAWTWGAMETLQALRLAGVEVSDETFERALSFLRGQPIKGDRSSPPSPQDSRTDDA